MHDTLSYQECKFGWGGGILWLKKNFFLLQIAKLVQFTIRKYRELEKRLGRIYRRYKHPDGKGKKGGIATGNDNDEQLEPIYEEIPEQRSITMLPPSAIESNWSSELGMEYDDVETVLLGKLSAKDLEGVVDIEPEGKEEFTPLQFEVEADVEPVKQQPLYANIPADKELSPKVDIESDGEEYISLQFEVEADVEPEKEQPLYMNIPADKELSPKVKKRRKSTQKHHSKVESTHRHSHHQGHHKRHKRHRTTEEGGHSREQGRNRFSPDQTHGEQSRPTHQMGAASLGRTLPPPPSFAPPPPPYVLPQRAPPNAPLLMDFTDTLPSPPQDSTPTPSKQ